MIFRAYVDSREHEVEVEPVEGGYKVTVDGSQRLIDSARLESTFYSMIVDGRSYEVSAREVGRDTYEVYHGGYQRLVRMVDPLVAAAGAAVGEQGPSEVEASMPGRVVSLLVAKGDVVEAGQGLLVIEAMKMENEVPAPRDGTVRELLVNTGETIEAGAVLAVIE